jgi:hypothetical protein
MFRRQMLFSILIVAQAALIQAQTSTITVLALLKNQPRHDIQLRTVSSGTALARLENRQAFARDAQAASYADRHFVAAHLRTLGASGVMQYTAVNAVSATLPSVNLDALASDPAIGRILRLNSTGSNNPMLDLLGQIDRTVMAASDTVVSASLPDGAADPDDSLSQLIDQLIDDYQLTLVLQGGTGDQSNALTLAASAATAVNMYKPEFVTAGPASVLEAIGRLGQSGVTQPLAQKALLINTADSSAGWSPETGWGGVNLDAISALTDPAFGQAVCVDQDRNPQSGAAACFLGSTASTQYYETKSGAPAKLTLVWNRSFASDGTPLPRNFELHVYDRAHNELAAAVSDTGNVLQVTAASDPSLLIKVVTNNTADGSGAQAQFALASSVQLQAATGPSTPPDPPQLSLSCVYSTQTAQATVITCTVTGLGGVPINGVTVIASSSGGDYRQVAVGTLTAGQTAQATFSYSSAGFAGSIWAQGTADQGLFFSNYLSYPTANQPPTPGAPGTCSAEAGIADAQPYPAVAGGGSVIVKTQVGCYTDVFLPQPQLTGLKGLDYGGGVGSRTASFLLDANILTDVSTPDRSWYLQVNTKSGINTTHIPVTQAGLSCNFQPVASLLTVPASGYLGTITMSVEPNCQWTQSVVIPTDATVHLFALGPPPYVGPPPISTGPGAIQYLVDATNSATDLTFTLRVGGKIITGVQRGTAPPPCTYSAAATGSLPIGFSGGSAGINITASPSACTSSVSNDSPSWLTLSGASNSGSWTDGLTAASNIIKLNASTPQRTAHVVVTGTSSTSSTPFSQSFSITQSGLQCSFTAPSTPFSIPAAGIPQSQPQSFPVGVTNPACQWTASSSTSFVHVVNDGVTQTGKTAYTVQYWADPNTTTTQRPASVQAGDQTVDFKEEGSNPPPPPPPPFDIGGTLTLAGGFDASKADIRIYDNNDGAAPAIKATIKGTTWSAAGLNKDHIYKVIPFGRPPLEPGVRDWEWVPGSYASVTSADPNIHALDFKLVRKPFFTVLVIDAKRLPIPEAVVSFKPVREDNPTPQGTNGEGKVAGYVREDIEYTVSVNSPGNPTFVTPNGTTLKGGSYNLLFQSSNYQSIIQITLTGAAADNDTGITGHAAALFQKGVSFDYTANPVVPLPTPDGLQADPPKQVGKDWVLIWHQQGFVEKTPSGRGVTYTAAPTMTVPAELPKGSAVQLTGAKKSTIANAFVQFTATATVPGK